MKNKTLKSGQILADMTRKKPRIEAFWKAYFIANCEKRVKPFMVEYGERLLEKEARAARLFKALPPPRNL